MLQIYVKVISILLMGIITKKLTIIDESML